MMMASKSSASDLSISANSPGRAASPSSGPWMLAGPVTGLRATISVSAPATSRAALPIFSVIEAVVLGLMTKMRMQSNSLAGVRPEGSAAKPHEHADPDEGQDDGEREQRRDRTERVEHRRGDVGRHAVDFERQRV